MPIHLHLVAVWHHLRHPLVVAVVWHRLLHHSVVAVWRHLHRHLVRVTMLSANPHLVIMPHHLRHLEEEVIKCNKILLLAEGMRIDKPSRVNFSPWASVPEGAAVNFHTNLEVETVVETAALEGVTSQTTATATMEVETVALEGVTSQTTTTETKIGKVSSLKVMEREVHAHSLPKAGVRKATIVSFRTILGVETQAFNNPTTGMAMALQDGDDSILPIRSVNQSGRSHLKNTVLLWSKISQMNAVIAIDLFHKVGLQLLTVLPLLVIFYLPLRLVS